MGIAKEGRVVVYVNDKRIELRCTPNKLKELAAGVAATMFGLSEIVDLSVNGNNARIVAKKSEKSEKKKQEFKVSISELKNKLKVLDIEEYRKTRGYHVSAIVKGDKIISLSYDVSRHACLAKAVGSTILEKKSLEKSYIVFSGRISSSIVEMCDKAGLSLIVSKAAIFDSAIELCIKLGVTAVSFASGVVVGSNVLMDIQHD